MGDEASKCPTTPPMDIIKKALEKYRHDIQEERCVRNRPRKVLKYAIWTELYNIVFQKTSDVPEQINNTKELVLAAIKLIKTHDFMMTSFSDVYKFNTIVENLNNTEIYAEFINGTDTSNALHDLEPVFHTFLQETKIDCGAHAK
jgi:hypothetical protein